MRARQEHKRRKRSAIARTARLRAALADRSGLAATEFALILPIMVLLFFGMLEISDAMMANRRVATATNALTDLIAQENDISFAEIDQVMTGVSRMLDIRPGSTVDMRVTSVIRDPNDNTRVIVAWSRNKTGGTPYAANSLFTKLDDDSVVNVDASLIVAELEYTYVSGLTSKVLQTPFVFRRTASRWPRQSGKVVLCGSNPLPACT